MSPPTANMLRVLRLLLEGRSADFGCRTQSEHGGRSCTLFALRRNGLIDGDYKLTDAGKELLRCASRG